MPWLTARENVCLVLPQEPGSAEAAREILDEVGLQGFEDAYPGRLSGGMQRRVALARAFSVMPALLLMDEPFASLDEPLAWRLRGGLHALWHQRRPTVLFVTHDFTEALSLADRVLFLSPRPGRIVLEQTVGLPHPRESGDPGVERLRADLLARHPALLAGQIGRAPPAGAGGSGAVAPEAGCRMSQSGTTTPALEVRQVSKSYGAPPKALDEASLTVGRGEFVGLLGPNGAGKTTLFQILSGLFVADAGSVHVLGHDMRHAATEALAGIGVVFQQPTLDLDLSVRANLRFSARMHGMSRAHRRERIEAELERLELDERANAPARSLSGGNRRRVELAPRAGPRARACFSWTKPRSASIRPRAGSSSTTCCCCAASDPSACSGRRTW